jgi:hypothetical protein
VRNIQDEILEEVLEVVWQFTELPELEAWHAEVKELMPYGILGFKIKELFCSTENEGNDNHIINIRFFYFNVHCDISLSHKGEIGSIHSWKYSLCALYVFSIRLFHLSASELEIKRHIPRIWAC